MKNITKTQDDIVRELSDKTGYPVYKLREIIDALEEVIIEGMCEATFEQQTGIRLFPGFIIGAKLIPEKIVMSPYYKKFVTSKEHLMPFATVSPYLKRKINDFNTNRILNLTEEGDDDIECEADETE